MYRFQEFLVQYTQASKVSPPRERRAVPLRPLLREGVLLDFCLLGLLLLSHDVAGHPVCTVLLLGQHHTL